MSPLAGTRKDVDGDGSSYSSSGSSRSPVENEKQIQKPQRSLNSTEDEDVEAQRQSTRRRDFIHVKQREKFYQIWRPKNLPPPPPASLEDAKMIPLENAGPISVLTYQWAQPIMILGFQRALEATDLYKLGPSQGSEVMSKEFLRLWDASVKKADEYNVKLQNGEIPVGWRRNLNWKLANAYFTLTGRSKRALNLEEREKQWRSPPPKSQSPNDSVVNRSGYQVAQVWRSLMWMFRRDLMIAIVVKVFGDIAQMTSPLLIRVIIEFGTQKFEHVKNPAAHDPSNGVGVGYAIALFVMQVLASLFQHQFFFRSMSVGVHARSTLISSLFTRSMQLGGKDRSPGKLLNHASTDCSRIDFASQWGALAITSPFALGLCVASALVGFALLVLFMPLQASMMYTDKRSKLINELLTSIRVVKSFAQENKFLERLSAIRRKEMIGIRRLLIFRAVNNAVAFSLPSLAAVVAFVLYNHLEGGFTIETIKGIFTALTLFQLLRLPLMFLPLSLSALTDGYNASLRLNTVFMADALEDHSEHDDTIKYALKVEDASFQYDEVKKEDDMPKSKKKMAAEAKVAKQAATAAANANKNDVNKNQSARDRMRNALSLVSRPQSGINTPQSGAATPKDHPDAVDQIKAEHATEKVSGAPMDSLGTAQTGAPLNEATEAAIDESSSGIVKAATEKHEEPFTLDRVNLTVQRGELLAIVGPVGSGKSTLFESLLGEVRYKSGRIIWGGTGTVAYCPQSPWIQAATVRENIVFGRPFDEERYWAIIKQAELESDLVILPQGDQTEIGERGTTLSGGQKARVNLARALYYDADTYMFDDPLSAVDPHVAKALFHNAILGLKAQGKTVMLITHAIHVLPETDRIITMLDGQIVETGTYSELEHSNGAFAKLVEEFGGEQEEEEEEEEGIENGQEGKNVKKHYSRAEMTDPSGKKDPLSQEERNTGAMGSKVYAAYLRAGRGNILFPMLLVSVALMQGATVINSYWLVWWEGLKFGDKQAFYMGIYAALGIAQAVATFLMGAVSGIFTYYAARNLHQDAIRRLLFAPLNTFFDVQPKGRILNRFTKDMDTLDNLLPDSARMAVSTLGTVLVLTHYFVIAVAVVVFFYAIASIMYRRGAREVKRLDALLRSALYSHFSETLTGLATLRAYQETERFRSDHHRHLDIENRAYFFSICNQRFLGVRMDAIGALLVFVTALLATVGANALNPAEIGLALSFIWATRQVAEVENDMNSAEQQEAPQEIPEANLDPAWPKSGAIEFKDATLRYHINLSLKGGEKTAIVGRTGAGKSSLLTCLLRLIELERGNISKIGLADLLLFSGTIRSNLDPFNVYDEARLNDALKRSYLIASEDDQNPGNITSQLSSSVHLDTPLDEEGGNLSLGQRSLVSLARALVKDSQIILLDEATASVDVQTDALIQATIRREFAHKTLLTIAHRLRTIIGYDKVAVFEKGEVAEFGTPLELFDAGHIFYTMCEKANISREDVKLH
ncbi:uncharacterized protein FA14DRAFT_167758 [Meira miltonrushii]|uniref:Uncharacterized protein n=1 Tax=Meira miltonrushii TaxID=1280837 RepID=A0A316VIC8_9BASI|nr:uncharacterized protein FA14DRAFT_167758 [Meira miltonrushii]PWN35761.1 hypothetical protein FA14DRAFT_167758 [Meira miltonrushii]